MSILICIPSNSLFENAIRAAVAKVYEPEGNIVKVHRLNPPYTISVRGARNYEDELSTIAHIKEIISTVEMSAPADAGGPRC